MDGSNETFVIGYDGRAFIKGVGTANTVVVTLATGECRAAFPFTPQQGSQVVIGPVTCQ